MNFHKKERNYSGKDEDFCPNDGWVLFQTSELICGNLGKGLLGGTKPGLSRALGHTSHCPCPSKSLRAHRTSSRIGT